VTPGNVYWEINAMARLRREESQALTRSKLLESARIVVAREGYENASIDRITDEAGFSKGAFYSNFDNKEEIFLALLEKHSAEDVVELNALLADVDDPIRMITIISDWTSFRSENPEWNLLAMELFMRARRDATFGKRHSELFKPQWKGLGRLLLKMFPEGKAPASAEALGALVFELTYGASSGYTSGAKVGGLVRLALTALYTAYGQKRKSDRAP